MNLIDLTEVLRDHAEPDDTEHTEHDVRMAGIRARVLATRRRLALGGVICAVLALVGAVYVVLPRPIEPAEPARSLPEYQDGTKLVTQAWADLPTNSISVEYTPKSDDFKVFTRCAIDSSEKNLVVWLVVNGHIRGGGDCLGDSTLKIGPFARYDGAAGEPLVITLIVGVGEMTEEHFDTKVEDIVPPDKTRTGELAVGVGEPVLFTEYPFPPRPETLRDVDDIVIMRPGDVRIQADRNDPDARQTRTIVWRGMLHIRSGFNTPGQLKVLINDEVVHEHASWSYGSASYESIEEVAGLNLSAGQTVTITVIPENITGDWTVQLADNG